MLIKYRSKCVNKGTTFSHKPLAYFWCFNLVCFKIVLTDAYSDGSDDVLAHKRRQAIIWTNDGLVNWRINLNMRQSALMS